ncbi:MAG: hypothetical protein JXA93_26420 [Anaerolineae bacterium]|nr:hypothetical protein [Anaerolineae bacterium]
MGRMTASIVLALGLVLTATLLAGCESLASSARRLRPGSSRRKQMERDAAHQRMMETLVALALVVLTLSLLAAVAVLLLARQWRVPERTLWIYLDQLQLRQVACKRELWHGLATMQRQALPVRDDRQRRIVDITLER